MDLGLPVLFSARRARMGAVPSFCRHNHLIQNCTICSREQHLAVRPIVSGGASTRERTQHDDEDRAGSPGQPRAARTPKPVGARSSGRDVRVRRLSRGADDGFHSSRVPGLRSSEDAERLAQELAFAARRLTAIETASTGLWLELADATSDIEERSWLAFLIAYIGPADSEEPFAAIETASTGLWLELADATSDIEERSWLAFLIAYIGPADSEEPFAAIEAARTTWASGEDPDWEGVEAGPRGAFDPERSEATLAAYRAWAQRAGSQAAAFTGESSWTPERRFERVYERLALPGLTRDARYEMLVLLGRSGVYELRGGTLALSGENEATWAAKRALGIGDPLLLARRAADLAAAFDAPLEAFDLGLHNWGSGKRTGAGLALDTEVDAEVLARAQDVLGL